MSIVAIRSRVALRRRVWRSGPTLDSSRVLVSAQIAIRQSACSIAHSWTGEIQSSWASDACLKYDACWPSKAIETTGMPPAWSTCS